MYKYGAQIFKDSKHMQSEKKLVRHIAETYKAKPNKGTCKCCSEEKYMTTFIKLEERKKKSITSTSYCM